MKLFTVGAVIFLVNLTAATKYYHRDDNTIYLNYSGLKNATGKIPENSTNVDVLRLIFMDDELEVLPFELLMSIPTLKDVQAEQCRMKTLPLTQEPHAGIQSLVLASNEISSLPDHVFVAMPNLHSLSLKRNEITEMSGTAFTNLTQLSVLNLIRNRITVLHPSVFSPLIKLTYLNLNFNQIEAIPADLFVNNTKLEYIFLGNNLIRTIAESAFQGARALNELELSANQLRALKLQVFSGNRRLKDLDLRHNSLENFDFDIFVSNSKLKSVRLSNNSINQLLASTGNWSKKLEVELDGNKLGDITNLTLLSIERLILTNNRQLEMNNSSFSGLRGVQFLVMRLVNMVTTDFLAVGLENLTHLDASMNRLDFDETGLQVIRLPSVLFLGLNSNAFTNLPAGGFAESPNLKKLFLAKNRISRISGMAFTNLSHLVELDLSVNKITVLEDSVFGPLRTLKRLSLARNKIEQLPVDLFKQNENLVRLDLSYNRISTMVDGCLPVNLKSVNLAGNFIQSLQLSMFENLKQLVKLDLVRNQLRSFDFDVLKPCDQIGQVKLAGNNLTQVLATAGGMQNFRPLRVYLENNDLTDISSLIHFDLQELDLSNNSRLELQTDSFEKHHSLEFLGLQGINLNVSLLQAGLLKNLTKLKTLILASNDLMVIELSTLPQSLEYLNANEANLREIVGFKQMVEILPLLEAMDIAGNRWSCEYWEMMKENFQTYGVYQPEFCPMYAETG